MTADPSAVGRIGVLLTGTRGPAGPGEVLLPIRGGTETYRACSDEPLPQGATVLVVESRTHRVLDVIAWSDPFIDS